MAIIDTLVVQIALDGKAFIKGTKEAEEALEKVNKSAGKSASNITEAGKKGADSFALFRREALGALALFTGGASIAKFTGDIAAANTALGNLSKQLDIAPQKLTQLRAAAKASGINPGDIDAFFTGVQNKFADPAGRAQLTSISGYLGIDPINQKTGHPNADLLDQIAHSTVFQRSSRAVQDDLIQQIGGPSSLNNLIGRADYDELVKRFNNLGPSKQQIQQGKQLLADWTELKENTNQVMQQVFSELEPTLDQFLKSLISLEKAHPQAIANGITSLATAFTLLSGILTARGFLNAVTALAGLGGAGKLGLLGRLGLGGAAIVATASPAIRGDDRKTIEGGYEYESLVEHYKKRTGAWTAFNFDEKKEKQVLEDEYRKNISIDKDEPKQEEHIARKLRSLIIPDAQAEPLGNRNPISDTTGLDLERLTGAVALQESGGNPYAQSKAGAQGLLQLMPGTGRDVGVRNPFDAEDSWQGGKKYLSQLLSKYRDGEKALAAYNWGPGHLDKDIHKNGDSWKSFLPKETSDYIRRVSQNYSSGRVVKLTHNTSNPNVSITINGAGKSAHEIAQEVVRQIPRQTADHNISTVM